MASSWMLFLVIMPSEKVWVSSRSTCLRIASGAEFLITVMLSLGTSAMTK